MANDWFQFKQFTIVQNSCAMKVSTDACIQGAYFAEWLISQKHQVNQFLDIGVGTGLLSLMLSQNFPAAQGYGIEIDADAVAQAQENYAKSAWATQLSLTHLDCNEFNLQLKTPLWDTVICNPPFFHQQLGSTSLPRRTARHSDTLNKETLAITIKKALQPEGYACVLFPASEWLAWSRIAEQENLHCVAQLNIFPNAHKDANRIVGIYNSVKLDAAAPTIDSLVIYEAPQQYTKVFKLLMRPYYLNL
jgi:tRNA1Val (adenine37-N6)-methyltransferase